MRRKAPKPAVYRVCYDDVRNRRVGRKRGPGMALPKFTDLEQARAKCRELNAKLNELYGVPRPKKGRCRFPIYFVDSDFCFNLRPGDDE